jgi:hypothetical protein
MNTTTMISMRVKPLTKRAFAERREERENNLPTHPSVIIAAPPHPSSTLARPGQFFNAPVG